MNCPSRTDEPPRDAGWNQNPPVLSSDLTTRQDLNGIVNLRTNPESKKGQDDSKAQSEDIPLDSVNANLDGRRWRRFRRARSGSELYGSQALSGSTAVPNSANSNRRDGWSIWARDRIRRICAVFAKFGGFIGPGFMVAVAYIDPGNYSTDVAAGAATRFKLLFIVLMSNIFAIVLQSLAVRLGTVTGMNLAEHCRAHLPMWLNIILYILGEAAIIATDIAEVIGSAIALNLLLKIPLVAGCAITLVDVLVILLFYSPTGSMRRLRAFEYFVMALVLGVVICFCIQLSLIGPETTVGAVFAGYLPSSSVIRGQGIYLSCGILGATVMPHSLYLGSGMVQARLREYDISAGNFVAHASSDTPERQPHPSTNATTTDTESIHTSNQDKLPLYQPSLSAIRYCLHYSTVEVALSLFTFALFVNSAILIVAGASLYNPSDPSETDSLFSIHTLLSHSVAPAAGTIFALALLLSGTSAGIVCTIAGQMLSEGALNWTVRPWMRRLLTRSISITPSIIIAAAVGKRGLSTALNASQVALSVVLPFVSAPLIYFTCRNKYMVVGGATARRRGADSTPSHDNTGASHDITTTTTTAPTATATDTDAETADEPDPQERVKMRNHILVSALAVAIWLVITVMNVALLVLLGLGKA